MDEFDNDLLEIFIEETFQKSEPIREKPIQHFIERVWIKDKRPKKTINGVVVKCEPFQRKTITDRFAELQNQRQQSGVVFESDEVEADVDGADDDDDDDQFEDINETDDTLREELALTSSTSMRRANKRKLVISLAKKLKKKSIANRLGMMYMPGKTKARVVTKSWSEKFGKLLAAKKLLHLPLLYKKYRAGPMKSKQELDIEIDLYMSEVKTRKKKLILDDITNAMNTSVDPNNNPGFQVVDAKELFGGFGGPGWRKRLGRAKPDTDVKPDKDELDMEIDDYMANKTVPKTLICAPDGPKAFISVPALVENKEELDMDLDNYMAAVKNKTNKPEVITNGF